MAGAGDAWKGKARLGMAGNIEIADVRYSNGVLSFEFALPPRALKRFADMLISDGYLPKRQARNDGAITEALSRAFGDFLCEKLCR